MMPQPSGATVAPGSFWSGFAIQAQVVGALMLRELPTRFGRQNLGALWVVLDPVIVIGLLTASFAIMGSVDRHGLTGAAFYATGYVPFKLFNNSISRARTGLNGNRGLLAYPRVTMLDILISRALLEGATFLLVGIAVGAGLVGMGLAPPPDRPLRLVADLGLALLLGFGFGLVVGSASVRFTLVDRIVDPLLQVNFLAAGVFFVPIDLPVPVREALLWHPVIHITESARLSWLAESFPAEGSLTYVLLFSLVLVFFGLLAERMNRRFVSDTVW